MNAENMMVHARLHCWSCKHDWFSSFKLEDGPDTTPRVCPQCNCAVVTRDVVVAPIGVMVSRDERAECMS